MRKYFYCFFLTGSAFALVNCTTGKKAQTSPPVSTGSGISVEGKSLEEVKSQISEQYTQVQLDEGKTIFQQNCSKCHKAYSPASRSFSTWQKVLPRMIRLSKLNDGEAALVHAFIYAHTEK